MTGTKRKHRMALLNSSGHTLVEWEIENKEEVKEAEKAYAYKVGEGCAPFAVYEDGETVQMDRFDPHVETILFAVPMVGG